MPHTSSGETVGQVESASVVRTIAGLHARLHFSYGAVADGSLKTEVLPGGGVRRRLAKCRLRRRL